VARARAPCVCVCVCVCVVVCVCPSHLRTAYNNTSTPWLHVFVVHLYYVIAKVFCFPLSVEGTEIID
jgi:hypothetical protein